MSTHWLKDDMLACTSARSKSSLACLLTTWKIFRILSPRTFVLLTNINRVSSNEFYFCHLTFCRKKISAFLIVWPNFGYNSEYLVACCHSNFTHWGFIFELRSHLCALSHKWATFDQEHDVFNVGPLQMLKHTKLLREFLFVLFFPKDGYWKI